MSRMTDKLTCFFFGHTWDEGYAPDDLKICIVYECTRCHIKKHISIRKIIVRELMK
jgi:hypothetical protein